jgi:hypothetical protein
MIVWTSLPNRTKSYNYPEGGGVNVAAIWNEGYMSYHGRSHGGVYVFRNTDNSCREKSAKVIVDTDTSLKKKQEVLRSVEGQNRAV